MGRLGYIGVMDRRDVRSAKKGAEAREDRLKAALKANLARRKQQARARAGTPDDSEKDKSGKD